MKVFLELKSLASLIIQLPVHTFPYSLFSHITYLLQEYTHLILDHLAKQTSSFKLNTKCTLKCSAGSDCRVLCKAEPFTGPPVGFSSSLNKGCDDSLYTHCLTQDQQHFMCRHPHKDFLYRTDFKMEMSHSPPALLLDSVYPMIHRSLFSTGACTQLICGLVGWKSHIQNIF